jgi:PAS domain-containing protein
MNEFEENKVDTPERTVAERHIEAVRQQGGLFVEAVRRTRMPMLVTDATLPGNPIVFANHAFVDLSGYGMLRKTMIASVLRRRWMTECWWTRIRQFRWALCSPN